jgi:Tol biopolymer transport system component
MKTRRFLSGLGVILAVQFCFSCSSPAPEPDGPEVVPLDGRGGGVIAYCRQGPSLTEIYAVNADGSGNLRLINRGQGLNHPDWSPAGDRLALAGYADATTYSIYAVNADGSNLLRLTQAPAVLDKEPDWSPDGTKIAFVRDYSPNQSNRREIWVMDADGSNAHWTGIQGSGDTVEWSQDGARLLFSADTSAGWDIHTCLASGADTRQLSQAHSLDQMQPSWSADGTRVVFVDHQAGNWALTIMNADGTLPRPLLGLPRAIWMPKWSPNGALIAFTCSTPETPDHFEIYVVNADGTDMRRVTQTPAGSTAVDPDWKPVGH